MILLKYFVVMKMNLNITGNMLDIILIVILVLSIFNGWRNGLVDTLIRFVLTIIVIGASWFISKPMSIFIPLPELPLEAELITFIAPFLQRAIAFMGLLIILIIAKNLIYMLFKPIIMKIIEFIKIVDVIDSICGAVFNVAKNLIITSIFLACLNLPIFINGSTVLQESKGATLVMGVAPKVSDQLLDFGEKIVDFTQVETWANQEFTCKDMIYVLNTMNDFDVLTEENLTMFYQNYAGQLSQLPSSQVEESEYQELYTYIDKLPGNDDLKTELKNKLMY